MKPILFETITRAKYDALTDDDKKKKNYQIKEEDGSISKAIANLESGSGGGKTKIYTVTGNDGDFDIDMTVKDFNELFDNFDFDFAAYCIELSGMLMYPNAHYYNEDTNSKNIGIAVPGTEIMLWIRTSGDSVVIDGSAG